MPSFSGDQEGERRGSCLQRYAWFAEGLHRLGHLEARVPHLYLHEREDHRVVVLAEPGWPLERLHAGPEVVLQPLFLYPACALKLRLLPCTWKNALE